jgi:hypothetical protein
VSCGREVGIDRLVSVTAHELAHLRQGHRGVYRIHKATPGMVEAHARRVQGEVDAKYLAHRSALWNDWRQFDKAPTSRAARAAEQAARREQSARDALERWEGKLRSAQRLVAKHRRRVRYYDRKRRKQAETQAAAQAAIASHSAPAGEAQP